MKYQLVLQFSGETEEDLDAVVDLEDQLAEALGEDADVDGHDIGSGQTNLFILTSDPSATFQSANPVIQKAKMLKEEPDGGFPRRGRRGLHDHLAQRLQEEVRGFMRYCRTRSLHTNRRLAFRVRAPRSIRRWIRCECPVPAAVGEL